jgi:hypothetical protein
MLAIVCCHLTTSAGSMKICGMHQRPKMWWYINRRKHVFNAKGVARVLLNVHKEMGINIKLNELLTDGSADGY